MNKILFNLAMIDSINFCKEHNIDPSGTHLVKYPKKYIYTLVKDDTGRAIITTSFYAWRVPEHYIHN